MPLKDLSKPTLKWEQRMKEGDDLFSEENIKATDQVLDTFVSDLSQLGNASTDEKILPVVQKGVEALNELNGKYSHIDTMEREELCGYILEAAKLVGYSKDDDLTLEWRWW